MRFLMLVCRDVADSPAPPTQADRDAAPDVAAWWQEVTDAGRHVLGDRLRPADQAATVRVREGEVLLTRGPFTELSEVVAGFDLLECGSMEEAVEIAAGHPMAHAGAVELRALWPFDEE